MLVQLLEFSIPDWRGKTDSVTARIYPNQDFTSGEGVTISTSPDNLWYREVDVTFDTTTPDVSGYSSTEVIIPTITLYSTDDSIDNPGVTYRLEFWRNNRRLQIVPEYSSFGVPALFSGASPSKRWVDLLDYTRRRRTHVFDVPITSLPIVNNADDLLAINPSVVNDNAGFNVGLAPATHNMVWAGPAVGSGTGTPTYRGLVEADLFTAIGGSAVATKPFLFFDNTGPNKSANFGLDQVNHRLVIGESGGIEFLHPTTQFIHVDGVSGTFRLQFPNVSTTQTLTLPDSQGSVANQVITTNGSGFLSFTSISSLITVPYDLIIQVNGVLSASHLVLNTKAGRGFTLTPGSSVGYAGTSAVAIQTDLILAVNGVTKATIRYAIGSHSATIVSPVTTTISIGDLITITGPVTPDAALANLAITLIGAA